MQIIVESEEGILKVLYHKHFVVLCLEFAGMCGRR